MTYRLLCDEMTEASLAEYCRKLGHDAQRVVALEELGPGSDDGTIITYAERENRILVTYDDDFLDHDALERVGVLFQPDDRTPPFETANVIDAVSSHVDQQAIISHDEAFHLTTNWL